MTLVDADLTEELAAMAYERTGQRRGYRKWDESDVGQEVCVRTRGLNNPAQETEWQSHLIRRYSFRIQTIREALEDRCIQEGWPFGLASQFGDHWLRA